LTGSLDFRKWRVGVARDNGSVVDKVQEAASMLGQDDLLLCTLNSSCKVVVVGLLKLLARLHNVSGVSETLSGCPYDVAELGFGNQALSLCADELLFKLDDLSALRLLVLQLGNLV
jgi:hypothetical protein